MKKLAILTSMLALAACGGGSGGGSGTHSPSSAVTPTPIMPTIPSSLRSGVTPGAATSNEEVTKMNSEVVVATNSANPGGVVVSRSGSKTATEGGYTFTSYMLDDVKFYAADAVTTQNGYLNLGINEDTGRIEKMYMVVGGIGANADQAIARDAENSTFKAPIFEYVQDEYKGSVSALGISGLDDPALEEERASHSWSSNGYWKLEGENYKYYKLGDEAIFRTVGTSTTTMDTLTDLESTNSLTGGHWNRTDEVLPVVTYGRDIDGHGTRLQYADFGHFNPVYETKRVYLDGGSEASGWTHDTQKGEHQTHNATEMAAELNAEDYQLFAGGYAINGNSMEADRPSLDPIEGQTYKGMAIGRVYTSIHGGDSFEHKKALWDNYGIAYDPSATEEQLKDTGHGIAKAFTTYDATMRITKDGNQIVQTLNMPFYTHANGDKFYDVEIKKTGDTVNHVNFTAGGTNGQDETGIGTQYRLYDAAAHFDTEHASFNPGYYGVNTSSEAAGTAAIRAGYDLEHGAERDYEVQAAYGMKLQNN